jgi:hypothetical protein
MSDRYMVIHPDTLEAMRRAGHVAKLEARIEKLEAALRGIIDRAEYRMGHHVTDAVCAIAREALEGKDD